MFVLAKRDDYFQGSENAFVSFRQGHVAFNANFCRLADLNPGMRVSYYPNEETRQIGFKFYKNGKEVIDSYSLSPDSSAVIGEKRRSVFTTIGSLRKYPWVTIVEKLDTKQRRFEPIKICTEVGVLWVIQLLPAFEERKARESEKIPSDAQGIYRYVRNGEIVYIGRGNILSRKNTEERKDWDYDAIEYSLVKDADNQVKYEDYWLEKFKEQNEGNLPIYNKLSGCKNFREK